MLKIFFLRLNTSHSTNKPIIHVVYGHFNYKKKHFLIIEAKLTKLPVSIPSVTSLVRRHDTSDTVSVSYRIKILLRSFNIYNSKYYTKVNS